MSPLIWRSYTIDAHICKWIRIHMRNTYAYTRMHVHMHMHIHIHTNIHTYTYMYTHIYGHTYIYIYKHIHTYINLQPHIRRYTTCIYICLHTLLRLCNRALRVLPALLTSQAMCWCQVDAEHAGKPREGLL